MRRGVKAEREIFELYLKILVELQLVPSTVRSSEDTILNLANMVLMVPDFPMMDVNT